MMWGEKKMAPSIQPSSCNILFNNPLFRLVTLKAKGGCSV